MANAITLPLDKGCATGIDPTLIKPGQLQESEGVAYEISNPALHKVGGRTLFGTVTGAPAGNAIGGVNFVSFDTNGVDYMTVQTSTYHLAAPTTTGAFGTIRTGLTSTAIMVDRTKFADEAFFCNGTNANWVMQYNQTGYNWGMIAQTVAPTASLGGTGLTGTYKYWTTEVGSNSVEGANSNAVLTVNPANQTVTVTRPATADASATVWKLYRTIAGGSFPTGWLVATVGLGSTYADSTSDAALVLGTPYPVVSINEVPEGQNFPPPTLRSVETFEGSIVGVTARSLYFSETSTPHYFPQSYVLNFRPRWGGQARCVRAVNNVLIVLFDHDAFRVNSLPKAADSFFDAGVVQEHVANFGTVSPLGAARFSGWGGTEMLFFWDKSGPMLTDGNAFDRAVDNIDVSIIPAGSLPYMTVIDNPARFRIEVTYQDANSAFRRLDFYYDSTRVTQERGFPELAWTGPHLVPGPGTYGTLNGVGTVFTGSRMAATYGKAYVEDNGTIDNANLVDSSGTVNFRARTGRLYVDGINSQAMVTRLFLSKSSDGTGSYTTTLNTWSEGDVSQPVATTHTIDAVLQGASSEDFGRGGQSFDVRIVRDDAAAMPPINNVTLVVEDVGKFVKTNRR